MLTEPQFHTGDSSRNGKWTMQVRNHLFAELRAFYVIHRRSLALTCVDSSLQYEVEQSLPLYLFVP